MLDVKGLHDKILNWIKDNQTTTEILTVTTGSSQYDAHYWGDLNTTTSNIVSVEIIGVTYNRIAHTQIVGDAIRVWTTLANATVTLRVTRWGGVVRKLLNTLKLLTSERGWVFC